MQTLDQNKASKLLNLISGRDKCGSKLSEENRRRLEELKSRYRSLKYELDLTLGKGGEYNGVMQEFLMLKTDTN